MALGDITNSAGKPAALLENPDKENEPVSQQESERGNTGEGLPSVESLWVITWCLCVKYVCTLGNSLLAIHR